MDSFVVRADTSELIAALNRFPDRMHLSLDSAAKITAHRIAEEARRRVRRGATGETAKGIQIEPTHARDGYVVLSARQQQYNLPLWLEFGTSKMTARPYFFAAADLESDAHDRRVREAIQRAIDSEGLGA